MDTETRSSRSRRQSPGAFELYALLLFAVLVLIFAIRCLATPDREMSESENRLLAQRPSVSAAALADGSFFGALEDWYADQFPGRDGWISLNLTGQRLLGRHESGNVYLGREGYLLARPEIPDEGLLSAKTDAIRRFAGAHPELNVTVAVVPSAASILTDRLPNNAPTEGQLRILSDIRAALGQAAACPDMAAALSPYAGDYIYYKTDHHWTSLGAYRAYEALAAPLGLTDLCPFRPMPVSDSFEGTLASRSGSHRAKDTIEIYVPETDIMYYVNYPDTGVKSRSLYQSACLEEKDQYTVFFGGNHPLVDIATTNNNDRCLLVLKDSYANCFMQFLTPYFERILMVDPRYYYDDPALLLSSEKVTDVLILYSADTFMTDTSLTDVLNAAG